MDALALSWQMIVFLGAMVFFAGFVDAAAGGGGLISIPAYLFTGMPPHVALACNKLSSACGTTFSAGRFFANGALDIRAALLAAVSSFGGSVVGTKIVLFIDADVLKTILAVALPIAAVIILSKRNYGERNDSSHIGAKAFVGLSLLIGFLLGMYDGALGPGTGTFAILAFTMMMHYDLKTASGNAKILNLASNYGSLMVFALSGAINYKIAVPAALCAIAGHYTGAGYAIKKGAAFIRPMMVFVMVLLFAKILWDVFGK